VVIAPYPPEPDPNPYRAPLAPSNQLSLPEEHRSRLLAGFLFLFSFRGRIPCSVWWTIMAVLPLTLGLAIDVAITCVGGDSADVVILILLVPPYFWVGIAAHVKRLHDRGKSAWWLLAVFIPIVGPIWLVAEFGLLRGTDGPNRYGPDWSKDLRAIHALLWIGIVWYANAMICTVLLAGGILHLFRVVWTK
jgi:uncharacterized membrane protein YhaH (DUF805 family)